MPEPEALDVASLRPTLRMVVALNLATFVLEVGAALGSGSVSLFADSADFLEDAAINLLILAGLEWSEQARGRLGTAFAAILLAPSLATLAMAWHRFSSGTAPAPLALSAVGLVALGVNAVCALLLARHRRARGSLTRAAFLSARNDTLANVAVIAAGAVTFLWRSPWPDLAVGVTIGLLNVGAAREVWEAARRERRAASLT